jgi:hypothetical protein
MVGTDDLRQLLAATTAAGTKTVLIGDEHPTPHIFTERIADTHEQPTGRLSLVRGKPTEAFEARLSSKVSSKWRLGAHPDRVGRELPVQESGGNRKKLEPWSPL